MSFDPKQLFFLFRPLGAVYAQLMRIRSFFYKINLLKRYRPRAAVISVGNLAMGGSGKTPVVIHLASLLQKKGFKPAVVSRGYGGRARHPVNIVADGTSILLDSDMAGDEPLLIAESVPGVVVLTGTDRRHPCQHAIERFGCNVILLDDGFQHLRLIRDTDIVVFNASELYENMHVFPGGLLREPLSALQRADCFLISGCSTVNHDKVSRFSSYLEERHPQIPLFHAQFLPRCYVDPSGKTSPLGRMPSSAVAFCGIASPGRFKASLEKLGVRPRAFKSFPDHHRYSKNDIATLENQAKKHRVEVLLTTEKDLVKLADYQWSLPVYALRMEVAVSSAFDKTVSAGIEMASSGGQPNRPR